MQTLHVIEGSLVRSILVSDQRTKSIEEQSCRSRKGTALLLPVV